MKFFFSYLFRSPIIRLTAFWFLVGVVGVSLFCWKVKDMRQDLVETNTKINSYITAMIKLEQQQEEEKQQLESIIETIGRYRPSVPELLDFIKDIETLARGRSLDLQLSSIKTGNSNVEEDKGIISYKLSLTADLDNVKGFLKDFEKSDYAIHIQSIDISKTEEQNFELNVTFILYTQIL
ncbi:MAG: type 4a pilus biogenesis protein PilO [bacterium]|nr:type 4a pilus biogenesis protein PilO [bacterium]